jgi:cell surface protein SprA
MMPIVTFSWHNTFKDNFDNALINYPLVNSAAQITKVELWITNTNRSTENVRNIVALADLGESVTTNIGNADISVTAPLSNFIPDNDVNELQSVLTANSPIRNISTVPDAFSRNRYYGSRS